MDGGVYFDNKSCICYRTYVYLKIGFVIEFYIYFSYTYKILFRIDYVVTKSISGFTAAFDVSA